MPVFRCSQCGCAENTALGCYWVIVGKLNSVFAPEDMAKGTTCSECGPKKYKDGTPTEFGKWHDQFPKRSANGMYIDNHGYVYDKPEYCEPHYGKIVGRINDQGIVEPICG